MALSSALGMLIGMTPYIGIQNYAAVIVSRLFRLPIYPLIIGVNIANPITIPFIFALTTKFGIWLLNMNVTVDIDWANLNLKMLLNTGKAFLLPFFVGTHVAGAILSVFTYLIVYYIMKMGRGVFAVNTAVDAIKQGGSAIISDDCAHKHKG